MSTECETQLLIGCWVELYKWFSSWSVLHCSLVVWQPQHIPESLGDGGKCCSAFIYPSLSRPHHRENSGTNDEATLTDRASFHNSSPIQDSHLRWALCLGFARSSLREAGTIHLLQLGEVVVNPSQICKIFFSIRANKSRSLFGCYLLLHCVQRCLSDGFMCYPSIGRKDWR